MSESLPFFHLVLTTSVSSATFSLFAFLISLVPISFFFVCVFFRTISHRIRCPVLVSKNLAEAIWKTAWKTAASCPSLAPVLTFRTPSTVKEKSCHRWRGGWKLDGMRSLSIGIRRDFERDRKERTNTREGGKNRGEVATLHTHLPYLQLRVAWPDAHAWYCSWVIRITCGCCCCCCWPCCWT